MKEHVKNLVLATAMIVAADAVTNEGIVDIGKADERLKGIVKTVSGTVCYSVGTALLCAEIVLGYDAISKRIK